MSRSLTIGANYDAHETLTVGDSPVSFTADTIGKNRAFAFVTVEDAAVRYWPDGTTPTATDGHALEPGDWLRLDNQAQLQKVEFISRDGGTARVICSFGG